MGGQGAESFSPHHPLPLTLVTRKVLTYWEKRGKEKTENGQEKQGMENLKFFEQRTFFFFFFFFFAFHSLRPLKFVWGLQKWKILLGKNIFYTGKKLGKVTLSPLKNIPLTPLHIYSVRAHTPVNDHPIVSVPHGNGILVHFW